MEVSGLEHHVASGLIRSTTLSTKDTCNTHRLFGIADRQIVLTQLMFITIECHEFGAFRLSAHHYLMTNHHICIEAMHRLTISHHDVVGNVNNIIDRTKSNHFQFVLQPLGAFLHIAIGHTQTNITLASLFVLNLNINGHIFVVNLKCFAIRTMQRCVIAILHQPSIQIASHTPMGKCISTVGSDVNLDDPIALQMIIFGGWSANNCIFGQDNDAIMTLANTNFVFSTNHAIRFNATQLSLLDNELLIAIIEHTTQIGHYHLLTSCHIRCTTDNLLRFSFPQINGGEMKMGVGDILACEHLAHKQPFQTAFDGLHFLQSIHLQTT